MFVRLGDIDTPIWVLILAIAIGAGMILAGSTALGIILIGLILLLFVVSRRRRRD